MVFRKMRTNLIVMAMCIALQPIALYASQPTQQSFSSTSFLDSIKAAWNNEDWKKVGLIAAAAAMVYGIYHYWMMTKPKPAEPQQKPLPTMPIKPVIPSQAQGQEQKKPEEQIIVQSVGKREGAVQYTLQEQPVVPIAQAPEVPQKTVKQIVQDFVGKQGGNQSQIPFEGKITEEQLAQWNQPPVIFAEQEQPVEPQQPQEITSPEPMPQPKPRAKKPLSSGEQAEKLIRGYVKAWIENNYKNMAQAFLEKDKMFSNLYNFRANKEIDENKTKDLFKELIDELQQVWNQSGIDYELTPEEVFDDIKDTIVAFRFGHNLDDCLETVFNLLEKKVMQNWDPALSEDEKQYLQSKLPKLPNALQLESNKKEYDFQDGILDVGRPSSVVIGVILFDIMALVEWGKVREPILDEDGLKKLLKKAERVFDNALRSTPDGYYSLNTKIDPADKKELEAIDWNYGTLNKYYSTKIIGEAFNKTVDRSKFSRTDFWLIKAWSIHNSGFNAVTAGQTCEFLKILQKDGKRFKNDLALQQAIEISCKKDETEKARIKKEQQERLQKELSIVDKP